MFPLNGQNAFLQKAFDILMKILKVKNTVKDVAYSLQTAWMTTMIFLALNFFIHSRSPTETQWFSDKVKTLLGKNLVSL